MRKLLLALIVVILLPLTIYAISIYKTIEQDGVKDVMLQEPWPITVEEEPHPQDSEPTSSEEEVSSAAPQSLKEVEVTKTPQSTKEANDVKPLPIDKPKYTKIPILMYHVIEDYSGTYEELYVSPQVFYQQLEYLKEQGYHTVKLQDVLDHWHNGKDLPEKPIVLSFDDGYRSMYTAALPILTEFEYQGTFFLHTNNIDTAGGLAKEMIQEMVASGMEIGSHTLSHPDLTKISTTRLQQELIDSKNILSEITGCSIQTFAYPAGRYNKEVLVQVEAAGYRGAVTTEYGSASAEQNPFCLKRIRINKSDGVKGFVKKLQANEPK
ncbi:MAG: polysaccharide deacetylase family protein [Peptococcia bacterium]